MGDYRVPDGCHRQELVVKKSRFIGAAGPAIDRTAAMAFLDQLKGEFPDANHHCWGCLFGNPKTATSAACSDDGEPQGTAGKPILNVLQHRGIGDIMLVVVRYFGGIKLGSGGLVRAYSGIASQLMADLPTVRYESRSQVSLQLDFAHEQGLRKWLSQHRGNLLEISYTELVKVKIEIPDTTHKDLQDWCQFRGVRVTTD